MYHAVAITLMAGSQPMRKLAQGPAPADEIPSASFRVGLDSSSTR